jgi:Neurotransmitter-gated ion-channel ligand binding domain
VSQNFVKYLQNVTNFRKYIFVKCREFSAKFIVLRNFATSLVSTCYSILRLTLPHDMPFITPPPVRNFATSLVSIFYSVLRLTLLLSCSMKFNAYPHGIPRVTPPPVRNFATYLGSICYSILRLTLLLSCSMKFNAYPHDMQLCHLSMESCEYTFPFAGMWR